MKCIFLKRTPGPACPRSLVHSHHHHQVSFQATHQAINWPLFFMTQDILRHSCNSKFSLVERNAPQKLRNKSSFKPVSDVTPELAPSWSTPYTLITPWLPTLLTAQIWNSKLFLDSVTWFHWQYQECPFYRDILEFLGQTAKLHKSFHQKNPIKGECLKVSREETLQRAAHWDLRRTLD